MQVLFNNNGRIFDYSLGDAQAAGAHEAGRPERLNAALRAAESGGDRVSISAEASNLQKTLQGESTARSGYNAAQALGRADQSAEENPDDKIRRLQKELREAVKAQAEAMRELQAASQALAEAQAAGLAEVKAERGVEESGAAASESGSTEGESGSTDEAGLKDKRGEAQKKVSEALAQISAIQKELEIAMKAKQAQASGAAGAAMNDTSVVSRAVASFKSAVVSGD